MVDYILDHQVDRKVTYNSVNRKAANQLIKHPMKGMAFTFKNFQKLLNCVGDKSSFDFIFLIKKNVLMRLGKRKSQGLEFKINP